jgi:hypothetical protein
MPGAAPGDGVLSEMLVITNAARSGCRTPSRVRLQRRRQATSLFAVDYDWLYLFRPDTLTLPSLGWFVEFEHSQRRGR